MDNCWLNVSNTKQQSPYTPTIFAVFRYQHHRFLNLWRRLFGRWHTAIVTLLSLTLHGPLLEYFMNILSWRQNIFRALRIILQSSALYPSFMVDMSLSITSVNWLTSSGLALSLTFGRLDYRECTTPLTHWLTCYLRFTKTTDYNKQLVILYI